MFVCLSVIGCSTRAVLLVTKNFSMVGSNVYIVGLGHFVAS